MLKQVKKKPVGVQPSVPERKLEEIDDEDRIGQESGSSGSVNNKTLELEKQF